MLTRFHVWITRCLKAPVMTSTPSTPLPPLHCAGCPWTPTGRRSIWSQVCISHNRSPFLRFLCHFISDLVLFPYDRETGDWWDDARHPVWLHWWVGGFDCHPKEELDPALRVELWLQGKKNSRFDLEFGDNLL